MTNLWADQTVVDWGTTLAHIAALPFDLPPSAH